MNRSSSSTSQAASAQPGSVGSAAHTSATGVRGRLFKEAVGPADDVFEREADRIADAVLRGDALPVGGWGWSAASSPDARVQRKCAECEGVEEVEEEEEEKIRRAPKASVAEAAAPAPARPATPGASAEAASPAPAPGLIAEDEADVGRAQMRKSDFLAALRVDICAAVDDALSGTGRDSEGCPWVDHWLGYYAERSAAQIERSLHHYAGEARTAASAQAYIRIVTARVGRSARTLARTGQITGVPEDAPGRPTPGGDVLDSFGGMFFKARPGGPRQEGPLSVREELGTGQALPDPLRTRMESAFGASFGHVRLHTGASAAQLSDRLNARAFTVGPHVAFGGGEFQPGTFAGEALIAHELAHVVQQHGAMPAAPSGRGYERLENDADEAATAVMLKSHAGMGKQALPRLRSGLTLLRCSKKESPAMNLKAFGPKEREAFLNAHFKKEDRKEAKAILDDILDSEDDLRYADNEELRSEIHKRLSTSRLMKKSQDLFGSAFEYPNHKKAKECNGGKNNPRVNKAAEKYWGPVQNDSSGSYFFDLSKAGKENAYEALTTLFTPQKSICDMTLIHCDYLASVVHFRAFADNIGKAEFNQRVKTGVIKMRLQWNGFEGVEEEGAPEAKGISLREFRPKSEKDLVIGDHVIFWNHRAYDAINEVPRNAWRLENAFLIEKKEEDDIFLGHGSGRKTNRQMRDKLAHEYNKVVAGAVKLVASIGKGDAKSATAKAEMASQFPAIKEHGGKWLIEAKKKTFDVKEIEGTDPNLTGLRDPSDPSKMNTVKRPVESE
jgi:hypothetical protein